ncbi:MAG: UDP-N-acetylmuramoyl-L-alanyl-D-glutamate--2,6-diaminopimelate ligase [Bacteroidetes bacterium]|nr:UDP-N-acetylmuramoyl-L-alanyl-D-glutamate--2,6-diaminopimelate ligase [Bacteroidota bacterium]
MVGLKEILHGINILKITGSQEIKVNRLQFDSREIEAEDLFVAVKGTQSDGHNYIRSAVDNGASVVVCEKIPARISERVACVRVSNSAVALGKIAANFYGNPSGTLKLVGVTGTNGKTTIVHLLFNLLRKYGYKAGLLSTTGNIVIDNEIPATHTTPDIVQINRLLAEMVKQGCEYAFMEVSSHALVQYRTAGLTFKGGIFTNITHDHLDYHKNFGQYINAKKKFFDDLGKDAFALVNADDKNYKIMVQNCNASISTYALRSVADFKGRIIESLYEGTQLELDNQEVWTRLIGEFNVYNLLAVYATASLLGLKKDDLIRFISKSEPVPGRFETIRSKGGVIAVVDYAHTPDALKNIMNVLVKIKKQNKQLITVIGAGGDRDKSKRPVMAGIAVTKSDKVILTSDNPRTENPQKIIDDMYKGVGKNEQRKVLILVDRKEAIKIACMLAEKEDVILIAGKGHETYQEIKGVKYHFDDREVVAGMFEALTM